MDGGNLVLGGASVDSNDVNLYNIKFFFFDVYCIIINYEL